MILRDPVHGLIAFESEEDAIVPALLGTPEVQRLRRIRQLGLTSFAFPGAEHTRFSHAVGTAHVMQRLLARLRQIDHALPFWQRVTSERACDAIAAALLHDVGHGPLSHLFEEAMPGALDHEAWTERVLLDPGSGVHRVLARDDAHRPRRVADLVRGRHELPYLARAVSGTFDVDRCDYLLRDAHATGVRHGEFDLAWLLRSLRFAEVDGDGGGAPGLAIDGAKGLAAIESFVLARFFMFQQVYFHKAARSAEWMIGAILRRALARVASGDRLPAFPAALAAAAAGETPRLADYLELDDVVLLGAIHAWESGPDPVLADLCKRLRARALFKTLELFPDGARHAATTSRQPGEAQEAAPLEGGGGGATPRAIARLPRDEWGAECLRAYETARELARAAGLDPDVYVGLDVAVDTPFADDESLTVIFPHGRPRKPADVSFLLERLRNETLTRVRLLFAPELQTAVREAVIR